MNRRLRSVALGAAACALLAACGSTVQLTSRTTAGSSGLGQGGLGSASGGTDGSNPNGTTGGGSTQGGPGATSTIGGVNGTTSSGSANGALPGPAQAPPAGTVLAPIQVGILLFPDLNQFAGMFGGTADAGNQSLEVDTAVNWVNKHGGAAGHQIVVIKHDVSLTSNETYDQLAEQACQDFTVDHHVAAVVAPGTAVSDNFAACLKNRGVLYLSSGLWIHDLTDWQQYPNMWSSGEADGRGVGQAMVDQVLGRSLAKKGDTVGLMVMTEPGAVRAADTIVKPQLKAAGINVTEYTVPPPASTSDISNSVAVDDSAELKMASQNIKTVLFLCPGCLAFFAHNADSQAYYPTYLGSTFDTPAGITTAAFDKSMKSAIMVGFEPDHDVGLYTHRNELTDNATRRLCHSIMGPSGQSTGDLSEFATVAICDNFLEVTYAAQLNPANPLTGPALRQGMGLFGTQHPSALNFATALAPNHHGGETEYRLMHWDLSTHLFAYDSATRLSFHLPS